VPEFAHGDAIGSEVLAIQKTLRSWGLRSEIFAQKIHRRLHDRARLVDEFPRQARAEDVVLAHFSLGHDIFEQLLDWPGRKVLRYHNITPDHFMEQVNSEVAERCRRGRRQLARLAPAVELGLGVSPYNCRELEEAGCPATQVVPILLNMSNLTAPPDPLVMHRYSDPARPLVLHVGRAAPNKKLEDLVRTQYWLERIAPGCRLVLVGAQTGMDPYAAGLRELIKKLRLASVRLPGHVSTAQLNALYRAASLYLCLSEHEGFCVPLVEAMHFGLPIVAYSAAGVPGTLGDGGILLEKKDPLYTAEVAARVIQDQGLHDQLARAGRRRLETFRPEAAAKRLRQALHDHLGLELN
jgi:glycosyltransferase involved in cell wall biosynthesis